MMFEGKHIHFSPVDNKPLCSYSVKLCKQRRLNKYAFCIRHILEDKSAPFKQCAHVARYNNQKCTNPIPSNEDREFCNSHMQVAGMLPKKERKNKKEKERDLFIPSDGKLKFADRLKALLKNDSSITNNEESFNDDPYAFPDPVTENGSSTPGLGFTMARATWNCPQKILDSANCENSLKNELTQFKNSTSVDCRSKSHAPKLSKTMNRLQAKIAENKLLDKLKKSQESSQQTNTSLPGTIKSEPLSPVAAPFPVQTSSPKTNPVCGRNKLLNKLLGSSKNICSADAINKDHSVVPVIDESEKSNISFLLSSALHKTSIDTSQVTSKHQTKIAPSDEPSNCSKSVTGMVVVKPRKNKFTVQEIRCTKTPPAIQRIEDIWQSRKKNCKDLYPLAFESSESDGSDSEDENHRLHHVQWISIWDRTTSGLHTNNTLTSRALQQCHLKKELGRGYEQLNRIHSLHHQKEDYHITLVQQLTEAAKRYPNRTAHLLLKKLKLVSRPKKIVKSFGVEKNTCCFQHDGVLCNKRSLPYTRHCDKHIMYNVDQLLFEHCTAKFADNTQCCVPVFDICHELPLCPEHAKKRDNYNKMASEPKPKKPRKKSKPSALTRPPKRGKKKKRQNQLRPTPSSSPVVDKTLNTSPSEVSGSIALDNAPSEAETRMTNTTVLAKDLGGNLDTELGTDLEEQFSPGTIDKSLELPLDTVELANQATKLLEEHDFTEVLNKIPDDAFSDLFTEARNGEYIPSREETEALERALAAVSKDVHLAKESLAKLSASGPDIDELAGTIDIPSGLLSADNLSGAIDENAFHDLGQGPIEGLGVIPNSLSSSDLTSLSQALSSITSDNLAQSSLPSVTEGHLRHSLASVPVLTSEVAAHTQVLNGLTGIHTIPSDTGFGLSSQFIESSTTVLNPVSTQNSVESRYLSNAPSLISSLLYGLSQNTTPQPPYPISHLPALNNSNSREEENLVTSTGGPTVANSSTHWLLNPSEQVLALSQMGYQNGFLVTSQAGGTYPGTQQLLTSVGKYPLQALSAEVSLVSSSTPLVTSTCSDSILCGASEEPLHNLHVSSSVTGTLQQTNTATVIAQEGAS